VTIETLELCKETNVEPELIEDANRVIRIDSAIKRLPVSRTAFRWRGAIVAGHTCDGEVLWHRHVEQGVVLLQRPLQLPEK